MKKNFTELVLILDKSGSMSGLENDTIGGFNSMLEKQKTVDGECRITTVLFDNTYTLLHDRIDIQAVSPMTNAEYSVGGSTALLDAIGLTINKLVSVQKNTSEDYRADKVMFVIITDGEENSSRKYSVDKVRSMIEHEKKKYGWEFIFLGANIDAVQTAQRFGIDADRAVDYVPDAKGTQLNFEAMAKTVACYRMTGAYGGNSERYEETRWPQMIGAIIGDIVGSVYEWNNIKTKEFPLFRDDCFFTDDTVMTCAVAEAVMNGGKRDDFIDAMKKYGRMYPDAGYGGRFGSWLFSDTREAYNSYGNGSAMRVSPCAWVMDCGFCAGTGMWPSNGRAGAQLSAEVTHNHPEGVKGAMATADAIFMCRYYFGGCYGDYERPINDNPAECKKRIKEHIEREYGYDLSRSIDEIRPTYHFNETCQDTVPQAIIAFLESTDFEDAIRNAISLGGDSDTLAAITGSIAEAAYGIPDWIKDKAYSYLDEPLKDVLRRWKKFVSKD